jgi:hypothetical protein
MGNKKTFLPQIVRKTIIIDDDYIRENYDGNTIKMLRGQTSDDVITIFEYKIGERLTLFDERKKQKLQQLIDNIVKNEPVTIAHESQHVHNASLGYHYVANSDNIYECMMLSLANEMSAMMAGYLQQTKNPDQAMVETINNLSGNVRKHYIQKEFADHFYYLQKIHGKNKNLYKHTFDAKKIHEIIDYYFTINGQKIMNQLSKTTLFAFSSFMVEIKSDINDFIDNQIMNNKSKDNTL